MADIQRITIHETEVPVLTYRNQRVVTFAMIDQVHQRPDGTARKRFQDNRKRFVEGEDFYRVDYEESAVFRTDGVSQTHSDMILLTESGYLLLTKSLRDDLAWKIQRKLIHAYFRVVETTLPQVKNPAHQMLIETIVRLDTVEQQVLTAQAEAQQSRELALQALQSQMWLPIAQYVIIHGLERQVPPPLQNQYGRWLTGYCQERGLPVYEIRNIKGYAENTYHVQVIQQTLPPWLTRRQGQANLLGISGEN